METKKRIEPQITEITDKIAMPERKRTSGSKSLYPFEQLTKAGQSFGVKNKTAAQLATIISSRNRKGVVPVYDAKGKPVMKTTAAKDAEGKEIQVPTSEPETKVEFKFYAVDVDPKSDPAGAICRVFREI